MLCSQMSRPVSDLPAGARRLLCTYAFLALAYMLAIQLYGPFLRSLVVCDARPDDKQSASFSGSAHCSDAHHVLRVAQQEEGSLVGMKLLVHGSAGPVLAVLADDIGRRPVLLAGLTGYTTAFALFALTAAFPELHHSTSIIPFAFFLEGAMGAFDVVYLSMLADMTPDQAMRAPVFAAYQAVSALAQAVSQLLAVVILRQCLESYVLVWLFHCALLLISICSVSVFVDETLGSRQGYAPSAWKNGRLLLGASRSALARVVGAPLELVIGSGFLRVWLLSSLLSSMSAGLSGIEASFTLAVYGWQPGDLQACIWPLKIMQLGSVTLLGPFAARYRASAVTALVTIMGCGASLFGVLAPFLPFALVGTSLLSSILAFGRPVTDAFLSSHFTGEQQAKLQALTHLCNNFGTSFSMALFSRPLLFQPTARGWAAARPFMFAAMLSCASGSIRLALLVQELRLPCRSWSRTRHYELHKV